MTSHQTLESLGDLFSDDSDTPLFESSIYYDLNSFQNLVAEHCQDDLSLFYGNIRSLLKNKQQLQILLQSLDEQCSFNFKILTIVETWLSKDLEDLAGLNGYNPIFKHKEPNKEGGGLAIYVEESIQYKIRTDLSFPDDMLNMFDCLFIEIINPLQSNNIVIGLIYRSPKYNSTCQLTSTLKDILEKLSKENKKIVITGDFNINLLKYDTNTSTLHFLDLMMQYNFMPKITIPTRVTASTATLIDHLYSNVDSQRCIAGTITTDITDHYSNFILVNTSLLKATNQKYIKYRQINVNTLNNLNEALQNTCWTEVLSIENDPTESYNKFLNIYNGLKDIHLPVITKRFNKYRHKNQPWITKGILKSLQTKDKLHTKATNANSNKKTEFKLAYDTYAKVYKKTVRMAKMNYWNNKLNEAKNDVKATWKNLNLILNRSKNKKNLPDKFIYNNLEITDEYEIANHFNKFYINIGPSLAKSINQQTTKSVKDYLKTNSSGNSLYLYPTSVTEISNIINDLKPKLSSGYDDINPRLLKQTFISILDPITHIANSSMTTGIFPSNMKIAKVIPVYKKGKQNQFNNYRPISLLPVFSKILERLIYNRLYKFLMSNKILSPCQYGFQRNKSTELAVLEMQDRIIHHLSKKLWSIGVFLDLSKAFDTIDHSILILKLQHYGIRGAPLDLFKNYLSNRSQFTMFKSTNSKILPVVCGVPQGSILGPLLFILYMNDIINAAENCAPILFADDTNLLFSGPNLHNLTIKVNNCLSNLAQWFSVNKLSLNVEKTHFAIFHSPNVSVPEDIPPIKIQNENLIRQSSTKFLGITIDESLNWQKHLHEISSKVSKVLGVLYRIKRQVPSESLRIIYHSLISSHLSYCITAWGNCKSKARTRLETLQKKAIRLISKAKYNSHCGPLFKLHKLLSISDLFLLNCCKLYIQCEKGNLPPYLQNQIKPISAIHDHSTRQQNDLHVPRTRFLIQKQFFSHKIANSWNQIPTRNRPPPQFSNITCTKTLKNYLISKYPTSCSIANCYICQINSTT